MGAKNCEMSELVYFTDGLFFDPFLGWVDSHENTKNSYVAFWHILSPKIFLTS